MNKAIKFLEASAFADLEPWYLIQSNEARDTPLLDFESRLRFLQIHWHLSDGLRDYVQDIDLNEAVTEQDNYSYECLMACGEDLNELRAWSPRFF